MNKIEGSNLDHDKISLENLTRQSKKTNQTIEIFIRNTEQRVQLLCFCASQNILLSLDVAEAFLK